jgi:glycosyltransferase involved in cell wall biosynthesis
MSHSYPKYEQDFRSLHACVLIPTYNNADTLADVIAAVAQSTHDIIVVNDGATDDTDHILSQFSFIKVVSYRPNHGKGYALKTGFRYALQQGFRYALTIDSDGQHYASDIPVFLEAARQQPDAVIIGARNMDQENVPGKSSFGNRFSNFWFWVETGLRLPDTQSGYRWYPLQPMATMKFFTTKYEFEIEVPVRLAWKGIAVKSVPVRVYYPPQEERISHFRPFKDFLRISILNTVLTLIALLWIHPRNFFRKLTSRQGWSQLYRQIFIHPEERNSHKALSMAFGVFMGILPVWGFQLLIGIPLAIFFRLTKTLFLIAANISIFPLTPVWWALSLITGKVILGYHDWAFHWQDISLQQFKEAGLAFFLGGTVLALATGALTYLLSLVLLNKFTKKEIGN